MMQAKNKAPKKVELLQHRLPRLLPFACFRVVAAPDADDKICMVTCSEQPGTEYTPGYNSTVQEESPRQLQEAWQQAGVHLSEERGDKKSYAYPYRTDTLV